MEEISVGKTLLNVLENMKRTQEKLERSRKAVFNILEDVEKEKKETEGQREELATILKSVGDGIYAVDRDKKIIVFNRAAEKITGFKKRSVIGKYCYDVLKFTNEAGTIDICKTACPVTKVFRTGKIVSLPKDTWLISKDGRKIAISDSAAPIKNPAGKIIGAIITFRDVTKEREINRMKTMFVSITSHQLRTPLSSLRWFTEMLLEGDAGQLNDPQKDYLNQIYDSTIRMIALVNDLLDVSRIEAGKIKIEPKPTQLEEIIESLVKEFEPIAKARNVTLLFLKTKEKLPAVYVDPTRIRQVIQNLLSNAINYNKPKGKVEITLEKINQEVLFVCKDTGLGIPKDQQSKVFSQFFRGTNVTFREVEGTGLGLYITKSIINSSGGRIWFESDEGKGTTFWFTLPVK